MEAGFYPGRYPAIVKTYDQATRTCRVEIPGLTDGGDVLPLAEIEYPIGDKSKTGSYATEIEILAGDTVWVAFIGGDPRYPVITGYRNPQSGNSVDWRRFHHANMELLADAVMRLFSGNQMKLDATSEIVLTAPTIKLNGNVQIVGDTLTHNGVNVGDTHTHGGVQTGSGNTGVPN